MSGDQRSPLYVICNALARQAAERTDQIQLYWWHEPQAEEILAALRAEGYELDGPEWSAPRT